MRNRQRWKTEPEIGERIEGEGLILLRVGVVKAVEEEPGRSVREAEEKRWRPDNGTPEFADGGGAEERGNGEKREDELCQVGAEFRKFSHC